VTAKRLSAEDLRTNLAHATKRLQELRDDAAKWRDQTSDPVHQREYAAEARAYSLSLDVLSAWTDGEFGEVRS
jgi:ABC-type Zn uptake system ZnuABC Zn-binding protein ZnuA